MPGRYHRSGILVEDSRCISTHESIVLLLFLNNGLHGVIEICVETTLWEVRSVNITHHTVIKKYSFVNLNGFIHLQNLLGIYEVD